MVPTCPMTNFFREFRTAARTLDHKGSLVIFAIVSFLTVLAYAPLRAATTALFIQAHGASHTPHVSLATVGALFAAVAVGNWLQKRFSVQTAFTIISAVSAAVFLAALSASQHGYKPATWILYIWKEIYIVFMIHLPWGYANNLLKERQAKVLFGLASALGSVGGVVGGAVASTVTRSYGVPFTVMSASAIIVLTAVLFAFSAKLPSEAPSKRESSPIRSLQGAGLYVAVICAIVGLTQFLVGILDLKFNLFVEQAFSNVADKSAYLSTAFSVLNGITLGVKVLILPFLLLMIENRRLQALTPILYLLIVLPGVALPQMAWLTAATYILIKGLDYSLFNVSKEMLYYPLTPRQKYGAKYLADVFVYRAAKAGISALLIFFQGGAFLNSMLIGILITWFVTTLLLWKTTPEQTPSIGAQEPA